MATEKTKVIIEVDFDDSDSRKRAVELNKNIKALTASQKELKKQGAEGSVQFQRNAEALKTNKTELNQTNKAIQNMTKANNSQAGSNDQLKAKLSLLTAEYNKLGKEERETSARGKELNAGINETTDELKGNEEAVGNNSRSVGDYGKALGGTPFGSFIGGIQAMGKAFLANPIGLIVTAIVLALKALFEAFKSTEKGENAVAKATAILGTIMDKLLDVIEPLAAFLVDVLGAAFQFVAEETSKAIDIINDGLSALGFEDAAEGLSNYRNELAKVVESAALIADARAKTDKIDRELIVETAKVAAQAADAREKALDDENIPAEERNRLLNEAATAIDALAAKEEKSATLKLKALQLENSLTNSNKEALDAQAEAEAELFAVQQKRSDAQKSLARDQLRVENEIKKSRQDRVAAAKAAVSEAINQSKAEIDLFVAQQGNRAKSLAEQIKTAETLRDKRMAILQRELDARLITQTEFETQSLGIQEEFLELQTQQVIDNAQVELDAILAANESKIEAGQFLNDELFAQEQERLSKSLEAQIAFEQERLNQGLITQEEFNNAVNNLNIENDAANKALDEEKAAADAEQKIVDLENQKEIDLLNREDAFALRQEELDRQKAQELAAAEKTGADKALIEAKFAALDKKLDQQKSASKLAIASSTFGNLVEIAGKESAAGKAFAIAQTTIDTFVGAQAAFNSLASIPIVGSILGAIAAAAAVAGGIARINKIKNTKAPKAAKGGIFGGNAHSSGGTKGYFSDGTQIEVEKGELFAVLNKNSTGAIQRMSDANVAGGGVAFARGGTKDFLQDGGIGLNGITDGVDSQVESSSQIIDAVESLPAPVVIVQDINEAVSSGIEVESRAVV